MAQFTQCWKMICLLPTALHTLSEMRPQAVHWKGEGFLIASMATVHAKICSAEAEFLTEWDLSMQTVSGLSKILR